MKLFILILKKLLYALGIHSNLLAWINSYIRNRTCTVYIEEYKSFPYTQVSGIPQGSVLGPLLFNLFINSINSCFKNSKFLLFADDLKVFLKIKSINDAIKLQSDLNRLMSWCSINKLQFNLNKCVHITYSHSRHPLHVSFSIGSSILETVYEINDLGIIFDTKFTFIPHLENLLPKVYSTLAFIKRNSFNFSDPYTMKILYTSFVRSKLEYGAIIWNPYHGIHIKRIEKIQKRFINFALKHIRFQDPLPSYEQRSLLIGLETLEMRRNVNLMSFIFDVINSNIDCPDILSKIFFNTPCRNLRHNNQFFIHIHRSDFALNNPITRALRLFNNLPPEITVEFNISKEHFKNFLFYILKKHCN